MYQWTFLGLEMEHKTWELSGRGAQAGVHEMCRYLPVPQVPRNWCIKSTSNPVEIRGWNGCCDRGKIYWGEKGRSVRGKKTTEGDLTPWRMWEQVRLLDMKLASLVNLPWCDFYHCWAVEVLQIHLVTACIIHVFIIYNLAKFTYCFCMNGVGWWLLEGSVMTILKLVQQ